VLTGVVLLHRQRSPEDLQLLLAFNKIRDTLFGQNGKQDIRKALELAAVCEHPNAVWLTKLFAGPDGASGEEARQVFLAVKTIQELFALLRCLRALMSRFVELPILAMRLPKRGWQYEVLVESDFVGGKICCSRRTRWFLLAWGFLSRWNWMRE
jgi:hypothetical protein